MCVFSADNNNMKKNIQQKEGSKMECLYCRNQAVEQMLCKNCIKEYACKKCGNVVDFTINGKLICVDCYRGKNVYYK